MRAEERRRAAEIVADRMAELGLSVNELAAKAGIDVTTLRAFLHGRRWPNDRTREKLAQALGWQVGDVARRALETYLPLNAVPTADLLDELCRRVHEGNVKFSPV